MGVDVLVEAPIVLEASSTDVKVILLQHFEVQHAGRAICLPLVAQRLLAFLALRARPQPRVHIAGVLWPDADEHHASANLRSTLWRVGQGGVPLLAHDDGSLRLRPGVTVDVWDAYSLASRLLDPSTPSLELRPDPTFSFVEDLLPDWYEDWILIERERFRQVRLHALEALCDRFADAGLMMQAIDAGLAAVTGEPLRESAHRALIRAYNMEGNRSEAVRQSLLCCKLLKDELGVEPSVELSRALAGMA